MPRQRKPQNSGTQRIGTGRVANTTTSMPKLQTVYRIPRGGGCGDDCGMDIEILGTSPVSIHREGETIWRISLDEGALKRVIENYETLELDNVTLQSVNGDVTFSGKITAEGGFEGDITAVNLTATNGNITTATINDLSASTSSLGAATSSSLDTATLAVSGTSTLSGNVTAESDLSVSGTLTAAQGDITTLNSTNANIESLTVTNGASVTNGLSADATTTETLRVDGNSTFVGGITAGDITSDGTTSLDTLIVSGNTTLNTLTTNGATTLNSNASVAGNLSVTGNETITGNITVTGDGVFSNDVSVARNLSVSGDATVSDDLRVNGSTHLKTLETTGSVSLGGNLSVDGSIAGGSSLVVENQIESGSVVTTNTVTDNLTINANGNIALGSNASAPDFILQREKGAANGVCPLNANTMVDEQYLPPIYTSAYVKIGTGTFSGSNTSVVLDEDITGDSFVAISNYQDIHGDLEEVIATGQLTVTSNYTGGVETGSYKYIVVNPLSNCPSCPEEDPNL